MFTASPYSALIAEPLAEIERRLNAMGLAPSQNFTLLSPRQAGLHAALEALRKGQFDISHEPVIHTGAGDIVYYEALTRLHDENGSPLSMFPTLMELQAWGLGRPFSALMLAHTLEAARDYSHVGININPMAIGDPKTRRVIETLLNATRRNCRPPDSLTLEIVEWAPLFITDPLIHWMKKMRTLGIRMALDDFGAPESFHTFAHATRLPLDFIKIDHAVTERLLAGDPPAWFDHLMNLAHERGIDLIAEHPETPKQARLLRRHGIERVQSHSLSPAYFTEGF